MKRTSFEAIPLDEPIDTAARTISEADVMAFAGVSGDFNPLHVDEEFAKAETPFGGRIAHGLLGVAISSGLGSEADEWDVQAYLECLRQFKGPVMLGDTVHARLTVVEKRRSRSRADVGIIKVAVDLVNQRGDVVQTGHDINLIRCAEADT